MSSERIESQPSRRWPLIALACCAVWLLLQNSVLLVWLSSEHLPSLFVAGRAMARVGMHLVAELWMLPVAVMLGVALALTGGERRSSSEAPGVSHAR